MELARYGVTVNAIAPAALTRMTENLGMGQASDEAKEQMSPRWIAPIITWLASTEARSVTGRVFDVSGRRLGVAEGWHIGPFEKPIDDPTSMGPLVEDLLSKARPERRHVRRRPQGLRTQTDPGRKGDDADQPGSCREHGRSR